VFFDSVEPLVSGVGNGFLGVYEWEAPGEGSCTPRAASPVTGGCTYLLSGDSSENSYLIDASANGDNVFFVSRAQLGEANRNGYEELYDARVGGARPPQGARCLGSGCQGEPPAPPVFATPASATFEGPGNPPPLKPVKSVKCSKGKRLSHGRCVKTKVKSTKGKHKAKARKSDWREQRESARASREGGR
jgi:hypothetical protein